VHNGDSYNKGEDDHEYTHNLSENQIIQINDIRTAQVREGEYDEKAEFQPSSCLYPVRDAGLVPDGMLLEFTGRS
jgi:hypothetical protein